MAFRSEGERLHKEPSTDTPKPKVLRKPRREELFKDKEQEAPENMRFYGHEKFKEWEQREARKAEKALESQRKAEEAEKPESQEILETEKKRTPRKEGDDFKKKRPFKSKREGFKGKRDGFKGKRDDSKKEHRDFKGKRKPESYPERKKRELKEKLMKQE